MNDLINRAKADLLDAEADASCEKINLRFSQVKALLSIAKSLDVVAEKMEKMDARYERHEKNHAA